ELDAVGRQRGTGLGGGHDEREQTLNQLLVEMDGFKANDGIILMAATNRPDVLDPALVRPGRFDLQVLVDNPDRFGRHEILQIHTRGKKLGPDVDLEVVATNTPGFSGAELEGAANNAAIVAARRINDEVAKLRKEKVSEEEIAKRVPQVITMDDMDEGVDRVQMGPAKEKAAQRMNRDDLVNTAYHELGHAWVSQVQHEKGLGGDPVTKITIVPRARALGYTQALPKGDRYNYTQANLKSRIMMAMGGRAAQEIFLNTIDTGASNDFKQAKAWAYRMVTEFGMSGLGPISVGEGGPNPFLGRSMATNHEIGPALQDKIDAEWVTLVNDCYKETLELLRKDEECIRKIAEILLEKETILGPEFEKLRNESKCAINKCTDCDVDAEGGPEKG
ncbi:MAG: AAA family ATPase, partial [Candidatus Obscuribacterales bacterium]|nr:AAA family ATPase [Candidatus Obscuribacterales bacterium]